MNNQENTINSASVEEIQQPAQKRYRRNKFDQTKRDFVCQCGKSYLSYPALYTHHKTKHHVSARSSYRQSSFRNAGHLSQSKSQQQCEILLKNILQQGQGLHLSRINYINKLLCQDDNRKNETISREGSIYVQKIQKYWKQHTKQDLKYENQVFSATIDQAFGLFLFYSKTELNQQTYNFFQKLISNMNKGLCQLNKDPLYCKNTNALRLPLQMNDLYSKFLQKIYCTQKYFKNRTLVCLAICHFNCWLLDEELTNLNLRLNIV